MTYLLRVFVKRFYFFWVSRFGPPLELISDKGSQFFSELINNISNTLGIHNVRTCSYNPRANGLVESFHRSLKVALKARGGDWLKQLPMALLGLRMHPDSDGSSCFSRMTGEQALLPAVVIEQSAVEDVYRSLQTLTFPYNVPVREKARSTFLKSSILPITCGSDWTECENLWRHRIKGHTEF